jgi:uncharacterized DUF497 family protein
MPFEGFEWDEEKSDRTFEERGFDFEFASWVFDGIHLERDDLGHSATERRFVVIGEVDGIVLRVVWTPRGTSRRILSARTASLREERRYRGHCNAIKRKQNERPRR